MKLNINDTYYPVEAILKPTNRNTYIKYNLGKFVITSPYYLDDKDILDIFNKNKEVFIKLIKKTEKNQVSKTNTIHIFGKEYRVNIIDSFKEYCEIDGDNLNIYQAGYGEDNIRFIVKYFLIKLLTNYISSIEDEVYQDFSDIVRTKPLIKFKDVTTYFGKCYFLKNEIVLNTKLVRYDKIYIKSVLYHEYCHFKYHNHQEEFYALYESRFPNAQNIQHALRQIKYNDLY